MKKNKRRFWLMLGIVIVLLAGAMLAAASGGRMWRLRAVVYKARDGAVFRDLSWPEVLRIAMPGSGFSPQPFGQGDSSADIGNPYISATDLEGAKSLFHQHCGVCHGSEAQGTNAAPALSGRTLARAHSDLSTYRIISRGIPGTSMQAHDLPWADRWRLVAYVDSIKAHEAAVARNLIGIDPDVRPEELVNAADHPEDWVTYSGQYSGQRFSRLAQVSSSNVQKLRVRWIQQLSGDFERQQTVPLVYHGIMYLTSPPANLIAADAATGKVLWTYSRPIPDDLRTCCGVVNRGAALLGKQVFFATIDAHLLALDATTGEVNWDRQVADYRQAYTITAAPLAVGDLIVTGIAGGDFATRGFVAAFRAKDGEPAWRFDAIPSPGTPGGDSWEGDSWRYGGGATWMTGSYDPSSNTLYWGVGNPVPEFNGEGRAGDNLFTESAVALDASTGKPRWHFQFTPHDLHGWDSTQVPVLVDEPAARGGGKSLAWPNRNGFFYSIDAQSGKFRQGMAYARQTWAEGLDAEGRPVVKSGTAPSPAGTLLWPSVDGATIWWPPAYNPLLHLIYVPVLERPGLFFSGERPVVKPGQYALGSTYQEVTGEAFHTAVRALDASTGRQVWEVRSPDRTAESEIGGLLATAGGLVFSSDQGVLQAMDARTGKLLWSFDAGARMIGPPVTYAVNGEQFLVIATGRVLLAFTLAP